MSKMSDANSVCIYCFDGTISDSNCEVCGQGIPMKDGIPSFISTSESVEFEKISRMLERAESDDVNEILSQIRGHYMDGTVVDRFFKTRTASWRFLASSHLTGRGLVIGDHEEKVGILLSEVLKETYTVDTSLTWLRAQSAIAEAMGTSIKPIHSDIKSLPFPPESFDVIAIDCRASEISEYMSVAVELLSEDGTVLLIVDGWPRESGITGLVGLGQPPDGALERVRSSVSGHSVGISRAVHKVGLTIANRCALLSTDSHENQIAFDVRSQPALDWLLHGLDKTASTTPLNIIRYLSRLARKGDILDQCYPRYLFVCKYDCGISQANDDLNSILIAGKNRSTVLSFDDGAVDTIRKVPNSLWQSELNSNAQGATDAVAGPVSKTLPDSELQQTVFGPERYERPVSGTPLDRLLERTYESVDKYIGIVFDWLIEFQQSNTVQWIKKSPEEVNCDLTIEQVGLTDPPEVNYTIEIPQVITHGDLFGSNIYIKDRKVTSVIDWEWAEQAGNPISDPGFFLLQLAAEMSDDFEDGFRKLFVEDNPWRSTIYKNIHNYCEEININPSVFILYLSKSYISRIEKDLRFNKRLDIDYPKRVQEIWRQHEITTAHLSEIY